MLANARMPVKFDRIFINDSLQVTAGRIDMLTSPHFRKYSLRRKLTSQPAPSPLT